MHTHVHSKSRFYSNHNFFLFFSEIFGLPDHLSVKDLEWTLAAVWDDSFYVSGQLNDMIGSLIFLHLLYEQIEPRLADKAIPNCDGCDRQLANQFGHACLQPWEYADFDDNLGNSIQDVLTEIDWRDLEAEFVSRVGIPSTRVMKFLKPTYWSLRSRASGLKLSLSSMHQFIYGKTLSSYEHIVKEIYSLVATKALWDLSIDLSYLIGSLN